MSPPPGNLPAVEGTDYVRDKDWKPAKRSYAGWLQYARRKADKMKPKGFWHPVVAWVEHRGAFRVSFGGMPENLLIK